MVAKRLAKELLRGLDVAMLAQAKVDRPAVLVHSAVQVNPLTSDFDVGFVHAPGATDWRARIAFIVFRIRAHGAASMPTSWAT